MTIRTKTKTVRTSTASPCPACAALRAENEALRKSLRAATDTCMEAIKQLIRPSPNETRDQEIAALREQGRMGFKAIGTKKRITENAARMAYNRVLQKRETEAQTFKEFERHVILQGMLPANAAALISLVTPTANGQKRT